MKKLILVPVIVILSAFAASLAGAETIKTHAISLVNPPKYKKDFAHFDYVNPNAPKGGTLKRAGFGTFDSFNSFAVKGRSAMGVGYIYDSLMESSADEPSAYYGLVAENLEYEADYSSVIFNLRKKAVFSDGHPLTSDDVVFSFYEITKVSPFYRNYFKLVKKVEALGPHKVKFTFDKEKTNKEMPLIAGQLTIIPKHYWEKRDLSKSTLEIPLGSGPYTIESFEPGKRVIYKRVKNYWAKNIPVNKGMYNFDKMTFEYFKDQTVSFEAFKAGVYDIKADLPGKRWFKEYTGKNFENGFIEKLEIPHEKPAGMAGFIMNTSVFPLTDINVRKALILAYDFDWVNKNFYYGQQKRYNSFFSNSELACSGLPEGKELEILNSVKDLVDPLIFIKEPFLPKTQGNGSNRENLKKAVILLKQAGYNYKNGFMTDKEGKKLKVEALIASKTLEKDLLPFQEKLSKIGIVLDIKFVDSTQYIEQIRNRNFRIIYTKFRQSLSPGNEQRGMWQSLTANESGSRNYAVLKNPAVDKLIQAIINSPDRPSLISASKALDRVLLSLSIIIPDGYTDKYLIACSTKIKRPAHPPKYSLSFNSWWIDTAREKEISSQPNLFSSQN